MKKFFKFALVAFAAVAVVACQKPAANNTPAEEGGQQGGGDKVLNSLTVAPATLELEVGATGNLTVTLDPADFSKEGLTWTSSNTAVATVANGVVTAVAAGEATIKAALSGKEGSCKVTVSAPATGGGREGKVLKLTPVNSENAIFEKEEYVDLATTGATFQVKFYANSWNQEGGCNRLCAFENYDESPSMLCRFSNDGTQPGQLRFNNNAWRVGGGDGVKLKDAEGNAYIFDAQKWHVLTLVLKAADEEGKVTVDFYDRSPSLAIIAVYMLCFF